MSRILQMINIYLPEKSVNEKPKCKPEEHSAADLLQQEKADVPDGYRTGVANLFEENYEGHHSYAIVKEGFPCHLSLECFRRPDSLEDTEYCYGVRRRHDGSEEQAIAK